MAGSCSFIKLRKEQRDKSYGIHVAQLAEPPNELIVRANEILTGLESNDTHPVKKEVTAAENIAEPQAQLSFFEDSEDLKKPVTSSKEKKFLDKVRALDILDMTPMQALNTLYEPHKKLKN